MKPSQKFELLWRSHNGKLLTKEVRFYDSRKWRFDYARIEARVAIEIEGGVWTGGRHTRPKGFIADAEKYNMASICGWTVFRLPPPIITSEWIKKIIDYVNLVE